MEISLIEEIRAIREGVAIYYPEGLGHIRLEGPEAGPFLQRIVTNDVMVPVGGGCHAAILDRKGMVRSLFYLARVAENAYHVVTAPQLKAKTLDILIKLKLREPIEIRDVSGGWSLTQLLGLKSLPPSDTSLLAPSTSLRAGKEGGRGGDFQWRDDFYKVPVWNMLYSSATGPGSGSAQPYSELSVRPGARPSPPAAEIPTISKEAFDLLRMESGIPEYGVDIDETTILLEANLPHTYKRFKGCYPGQEVIERILAYGKGRTPRTLCTLYLDGEHKIPPKTEISTRSGEKAGWITSALFNPLDKKTVLLGYLEQKYVGGPTNLQREGLRYILGTAAATPF